MDLKLFLPTKNLIDKEVTKVTAEGLEGSFSLLANHIDYVAAIIPGIFSYELKNGSEHFLAVDEGVLVKSGKHVFVSLANAIEGGDLGRLMNAVEEKFIKQNEKQQNARNAIVKMESVFMRGIVNWERS